MNRDSPVGYSLLNRGTCCSTDVRSVTAIQHTCRSGIPYVMMRVRFLRRRIPGVLERLLFAHRQGGTESLIQVLCD